MKSVAQPGRSLTASLFALLCILMYHTIILKIFGSVYFLNKFLNSLSYFSSSLYTYTFIYTYYVHLYLILFAAGSLDAESGIFASTFDLSGSRLVTCEADKTIKIWKENRECTEDTDPIEMEAWTKQCLALKRH